MPSPETPTPAPLRIGYVLKMYPRFSETFILTEILALEDAGTQVEIFSLRAPADGRFHERLADVRAPVTYLPYRARAAAVWEALREGAAVLPDLADHLDDLLAADPDEAAAAVRIAADVRRHRIDHLHAHFGTIATDVARLAARIAGVGYTFTAHAKDIFHTEVDPVALRRRVVDAAAVVTVSDYNVDHLRSGPAAGHPERVVKVYNGLDLERFAHRTGPRPASVCAVGRLVEKKGFDVLLQALALLRPRRPDLRLDLVGAGPEEQRLRDLCSALGLDDRVVFHGPLPQARVREVVAAAGVFAAPCVVGADGNRDGLPTVLLEALALGTPCVATPVTGIPEAVRHEETGLLVPESDPVALAAAIERLLDRPDEAAALAEAGRRLVERHFDTQVNAARLADLFRAVQEGVPA